MHLRERVWQVREGEGGEAVRRPGLIQHPAIHGARRAVNTPRISTMASAMAAHLLPLLRRGLRSFAAPYDLRNGLPTMLCALSMFPHLVCRAHC